MSKTIKEYLEFIDLRAPASHDSEEKIGDLTFKVKSNVWNPNKGKSSKMFVTLFKNYSLDNVESTLDIGTGSGILTLLLWKRGVKNITATDNMEESIINAKENFKLLNAKNIKLVKSDLFSNISGKFDLIIFNAPATHPLRKNISNKLLPLWSPEKNIRIRFLNSLKKHLTKNGRALLMTSKFIDFNPLPEEVLKKYPFSYKYLLKSKGELSESGIIEIKLR